MEKKKSSELLKKSIELWEKFQNILGKIGWIWGSDFWARNNCTICNI
jgi:hypothetical protein